MHAAPGLRCVMEIETARMVEGKPDVGLQGLGFEI